MRLNRMRIGVALTALMIATAANEPALPTVFGLEMGKPLSIPLCQHKRLADGTPSELLYEDDPAETCYEPDTQVRGAPWRRGSVDFPVKRTPLIIHGNIGFTLIIDGMLEGLDFDTLNHNNADGIINELTSKFGKPVSIERFDASVEGIELPAVEVNWRLPGLHVRYRSMELRSITGRF